MMALLSGSLLGNRSASKTDFVFFPESFFLVKSTPLLFSLISNFRNPILETVLERELVFVFPHLENIEELFINLPFQIDRDVQSANKFRQ